MNASLAIRPERPDQPDVIALLDALDAYLGSLYPPEANHILDVQALLAPGVRFHVARLDGAAAGTGACRVGADAGAGEIKRMYLAPSARGRGIGERLLGSLEDALRADGCRWSMLETGAEQTEAVRLYERCGYVRRGPFGGYPDNGLSIFYAKAL